MEIHATPGADRKATEARFSVMQFSLKDEHKIPGYDTFRSVFNMDPDERSDEDCDKLAMLNAAYESPSNPMTDWSDATFFGQKHGCTVLTTMRTEVPLLILRAATRARLLG